MPTMFQSFDSPANSETALEIINASCRAGDVNGLYNDVIRLRAAPWHFAYPGAYESQPTQAEMIAHARAILDMKYSR